MVKEGTYYKKIVTYTKNKENNVCLYFGILFIGMALGWIANIEPTTQNFVMPIILTIMGIFLFILNYFETHDRDVKYEKYEVSKK